MADYQGEILDLPFIDIPLLTMKGQHINAETYISNSLLSTFDQNENRKSLIPLYCCNYESAPERVTDPGTCVLPGNGRKS
jgi:hypothetical protein